MRRRDFVAGAAAAATWAELSQAAEPLADIPIVDTHIHLFDSPAPGRALFGIGAMDQGA